MVAAITDPYASVAEYRARVTSTGSADDAEILAQLNAVTQVFARQCGRFFTKDAAVVVRTFDSNGRERLWLPADIASATGLIVKVDLDGDYDFDAADETLTLNTHFWVGPANAALGPEAWPYEFLEIVPGNGRLGVWPEQKRSVQVTAQFGWPTVPGGIREATIAITRELRDLQESGYSMSLQNIDSAIAMSPNTARILGDVKRVYGKQEWFV